MERLDENVRVCVKCHLPNNVEPRVGMRRYLSAVSSGDIHLRIFVYEYSFSHVHLLNDI